MMPPVSVGDPIATIICAARPMAMIMYGESPWRYCRLIGTPTAMLLCAVRLVLTLLFAGGPHGDAMCWETT